MYSEKKKKELCCFPQPSLTFDCLFYCIWKFIASVGCSVLFFFFFYPAYNYIPFQQLIHSLLGFCIAICKLFYYFYIIIIKSLTLSSHHCEITSLFELKCNIQRLVCRFLCSFNIWGGGRGDGEVAGEGGWGASEKFIIVVFQSLFVDLKTDKNDSIFCDVLPCNLNTYGVI